MIQQMCTCEVVISLTEFNPCPIHGSIGKKEYERLQQKIEGLEKEYSKLNDWYEEALEEIQLLKCNNIECHCGRDVLKSVWEAINQVPACGIRAILCGAAQEIDALRGGEM